MSMMADLRNWLAMRIGEGLMNRENVALLVQQEIQRARMALPITSNYDPKGEGYRRLSGSDTRRRDLMPIAQDRMFEIAYYMWDSSAMMRRLAVMDRSFIFNGKIKIESDEPDVQDILNKFQDDPQNRIALRYPERAMWLSILGEQCWPVDVNPYNGFVRLTYRDPADIVDVYVNPQNIEQALLVEIRRAFASGATDKLAVIRKDSNIRSRSFDRLVGDCFFVKINAPPNSPRGRSDYLTLFDWIDGLERYGYNYLERAEFLLNFVWDVTLKGMTEDQIRDWTRNNPPPAPGSIRAHNENVTWDAVSPDIKANDFRGGYDMGKGIVMGAAGRPSSWFGEGGKAYQTEAEQFGQVPIADLNARSYLHECLLIEIGQFVIDQAVIHDVLSADKAAAGCRVAMPEVSKKDLTKLVNGIPQLSTALAVAQSNRWITQDEATRLFAFFASYLGYEIDAQAQIEAAAKAPAADEVDYDAMIDGPDIDKTLAEISLNGAQIASLLELLKSVAKEEIPRESALNMIITAFPIGRKEAESILGSVGKGFKAKDPSAVAKAPADDEGDDE